MHWDSLHDLPQNLLLDDNSKRSFQNLDCKASWWSLRKESGDGHVEIFEFGDGLKMILLNCRWREPLEIDIFDGEYLRFNFSLKLNIAMFMGEQTILAHEPAWRLINDEPKAVMRENLQTDTDSIWVTLVFKESYVEKLMGKDVWSKHPKLDILRKKSGRTLHKEFPFDHQLNLVSSQILSLNVSEDLFLLIAQAKARELLVLALDRLISSESYQDEHKIKLSEADRKALNLARDMLCANIANSVSIKELCAAVGINRNKLHYGFKSEFGATPQQLVEDRRLTLSYEALKDPERKIYQIALDVGYTNQGSFATAFKRRFGLTPKEVRQSFHGGGAG
ncbi:AraC family transcriptional regulator [uncultured Pseudoteredinibacter sp.]|uniref:helix-turn-helix domain-containing protein n=1 Tax=uncultured Pseudoteredinibacter sp. TaxID=1641701 RepID=UPI002625A50F|nr:AraC family transcriptional regulator [uncultured Pseudoteredinibacter sp.]